MTQTKEFIKQLETLLDTGWITDGEYLIPMNGGPLYKFRWKHKSHKTIPVGLIEMNGSHINGYKAVGFKGKNNVYIHRIVWETFKGPLTKDDVIKHKDGNRMNNRLDNLELLKKPEMALLEVMKRHDKGIYKRIMCVETGMEFNSIKEAGEWLLPFTKYSSLTSVKSAITQNLKWRISHVGGYSFTLIKK